MATALQTSQEELHRVITHEAFYEAQKAVSGMSLYTVTDDTFTIGPGTSTNIAIRRDARAGILHTDNQPDLPLIQYRSRRPASPFSSTVFSMTETAKEAIIDHVERTLGHQAKNDCYENAASKLVRSTAESVVSTTGLGYATVRNPAGLGHAALHRFIGKDRVHNALTIAGTKATLSDVNLLTRHQDAFDKARQHSPNSIIMWFLHHRHFDYTTLPKGADITPALILRQAKEGFAGSIPPNNRHDPDELWQTFLQLNHTAVARYAAYIITPAKLSALAIDAGANPPFSAIRTIHRLKLIRKNHLPPEFIHAFIRESATRQRNRKATHAQLATQIAAIQSPNRSKLVNREDADAIDLITYRLYNARQPAELDWQQVLDLYPPALAAITGKTRKKTSRKEKPPRATRPELEDIMAGPAHHVVVDALSNSLKVATTPGIRLEIKSWDRAEPLLAIEKQQDGVLSHSGAYTVDGDIPDPNRPGQPEPRWTTRGLKSEAAARKVMAFLTANWNTLAPQTDTPLPRIEKVTHLLQHLLAEDASQPEPRYTSDKSLSADLAEGLRSMVDPRIRDFTTDLAPHAGISEYNAVASATPETIQHLADTNPGAITWLLNIDRPDQLHPHPGEVIRIAKASMTRHGLEPKAWKSATTMSANAMRTVAEPPKDIEGYRLPKQPQPGPAEAFILNVIARARDIMRPETQDLLVSAVRQHITPEDLSGRHPRKAPNIQTCIFLMVKENPPHVPWQLRDILDYARDVSHRGDAITATTWGGLIKASDRWHRQLRLTPKTVQWNNILRTQDSLYRVWDSAVGEYTHEAYTVTPLLSEYDLYQESTRMDHCVIGYGDDCASGNSRIFSITKEGRNLATVELAKRTGRWKAAQVRGQYNHPVNQETQNVAQDLAKRYQKAAAQHSDKFWWTDEHSRNVLEEPSEPHHPPPPQPHDDGPAYIRENDELPF